MKKQNVVLFVTMLSLSYLFSSCINKMSNRIGNLKFDSIQVNQTVHLFNDTAKPACNIAINFTYPIKADDSTLKDSLNVYFINACFGEKYAQEQPQSVIKTYVEEYVQEYRHDLEPMYIEDEKNKENESSVDNWYSYYKNIESHIQYYEKNLLIYRIDYNEYTGGAHGMYSTSFLNIDLSLMRPLCLDDIFIGEYKEILTDLIWNQLMSENNVSSHEELEDLGFGSTGEIAPTENFYLSTEGITFYYNVYDIAPYAMGPIKITIPYPMIEEILNYQL